MTIPQSTHEVSNKNIHWLLVFGLQFTVLDSDHLPLQIYFRSLANGIQCGCPQAVIDPLGLFSKFVPYTIDLPQTALQRMLSLLPD